MQESTGRFHCKMLTQRSHCPGFKLSDLHRVEMLWAASNKTRTAADRAVYIFNFLLEQVDVSSRVGVAAPCHQGF